MRAEAVSLDTIPSTLFRTAPFQSGAAWWQCVMQAGMPLGNRALLLLGSGPADAAGLLPLCVGAAGLTGLVTPYTCLFQPLTMPGTDLAVLGQAFGQACSAWPVLRLDALDPAWAGWPPLLAGFGAAGWRAAWFDSFGNWHADASAGWDGYVAARPGALRETIRRKLRRAERDTSFAFTLATEPAAAAAAMEDYEAVYRRSWKQPEPFPAFAQAFAAAAASAGVLRLCVLRHAGVPIAAQYWTVEAGVATVLKLAHDSAADKLSPGTVLTAWMVRALLAEGAVMLDFGRGDDPYKQLWADGRRQRKGLLLAQPWRWHGAAALARQHVGAARRAIRRGLSKNLTHAG